MFVASASPPPLSLALYLGLAGGTPFRTLSDKYLCAVCFLSVIFVKHFVVYCLCSSYYEVDMAPLQSTLVICNVKDEDFAREVAILENMQIRMVSLYSMLSRYFYSCYRCFF